MMDDWNIDDFNFRDSNMDGQWSNRREFEVHLTTYDGAQHLRLNGWFKRNDVLVKSESIHNKNDIFGTFIIYINDIMLERLKEDNLERGLFCDIEVFNNEENRYYSYKIIKNEIAEILPDTLGIDDKIHKFFLDYELLKNDIDAVVANAMDQAYPEWRKDKKAYGDKWDKMKEKIKDGYRKMLKD